MALVLQLIPIIQGGLASLERIQQFLMSESIDGNEGKPVVQHTGTGNIELLPRNTQNNIINIEDATFGFNSGRPLLFNIHLKCQPNSLTLVVGTVGSGKSVLLRSLVGETRLLHGSFDPLSSGVAYCDQVI